MATSNQPTTANQTSILRASLTATPLRAFRLPIAPLPTAPRAPPPGFPNEASNPGSWPQKTTPTPQFPPVNTPRKSPPTPVSIFSFFSPLFPPSTPYHAQSPLSNPPRRAPSTSRPHPGGELPDCGSQASLPLVPWEGGTRLRKECSMSVSGGGWTGGREEEGAEGGERAARRLRRMRSGGTGAGEASHSAMTRSIPP